jgi:predicted HTH domain antitoxin
MDVKVTLPEDLARRSGLSGQDAPEQALFLLLLELYREGKLSLGRMAELVDLPQADLLQRMARHGTYLNYSSQDLEDDRKTLP